MDNLIVFDHPYGASASENIPHRRSFSAALCKSLIEKLERKGERVDLIDLHADGFDPVMTAANLANWRKGEPLNDQVADYQRRIQKADRLIFIFPVWWELMPAMTKGFIDKVYAKGILYEQPKKGPMRTKLSAHQKIVVYTVMGTPKVVYERIFGKPVIKALKLGTFMKTGVKDFTWKNFSGVDKLSLEERQRLLRRIDL